MLSRNVLALTEIEPVVGWWPRAPTGGMITHSWSLITSV